VAINIAVEIYGMVRADREKKGALKEVENKIMIVKTVLDMIDPPTVDGQVDIIRHIVQRLKQLSEEVMNVKKMKRFVYLLQAKGSQERLRYNVDTVQFYLKSLHIAQTSEISKLLRDDWSTAVEDDAGLLQQLEDERWRAAQLRRQVGARSLEVEQFKRMGILTREDLRESLAQADAIRRSLEHQAAAKSQQEAAYMEQMIYLIQQEEQWLQLVQSEDSVSIPSIAPSREDEPTVIRLPPIPECPISFERINDPVILDCKCRPTVDRKSFEVWLCHQTSTEAINSNGPPKCPCCSSTLLSMNVNPNVFLRDMIAATERLEQQILQTKQSKQEEDPLNSQAVIVPTDAEGGIVKKSLEKSETKNEDHPWNSQAVRVPTDVDQETVKIFQEDEFKFDESLVTGQAILVGWVGLQEEFSENQSKPEQEDPWVGEAVGAEIDKENPSKNREVPWINHDTRVPTDTCHENQSKLQEETLARQATRFAIDIEEGIPNKTFEEKPSKHEETFKSKYEETPSHRPMATVSSYLEEGAFQELCVESIQYPKIGVTGPEAIVVADCRRVNPCSGIGETDDERSPAESHETASKHCTMKRGLWSVVLLVFVVMTTVIALYLLKNDDRDRK